MLQGAALLVLLQRWLQRLSALSTSDSLVSLSSKLLRFSQHASSPQAAHSVLLLDWGPMRFMSSTTDIDLPECDGPKLKPFTFRDRKIQFVRLLSDPEYSGHAHVFEALIDAKPYALKVVSRS